MSDEQLTTDRQASFSECPKSDHKLQYREPRLTYFGTVRDLTQGGGSQGAEGGSGMGSFSSDSRVKENIARIGTHPMGFGLYVFDYKPEYRDIWGHGRQFGVMADEVEQVMPEAVSMHPDGYRMVNYAVLGVSRPVH